MEEVGCHVVGAIATGIHTFLRSLLFLHSKADNTPFSVYSQIYINVIFIFIVKWCWNFGCVYSQLCFFAFMAQNFRSRRWKLKFCTNLFYVIEKPNLGICFWCITTGFWRVTAQCFIPGNMHVCMVHDVEHSTPSPCLHSLLMLSNCFSNLERSVSQHGGLLSPCRIYVSLNFQNGHFFGNKILLKQCTAYRSLRALAFLIFITDYITDNNLS